VKVRYIAKTARIIELKRVLRNREGDFSSYRYVGIVEEFVFNPNLLFAYEEVLALHGNAGLSLELNAP